MSKVCELPDGQMLTIKKVIEYRTIASGQEQTDRYGYVVASQDADGKTICEKLYEDLSKINLFRDFRIPDAKISRKERDDILHQLQCIAADAGLEPEVKWILQPGFYELQKKPLFVLGDRVIKPEGAPADISIDGGVRIRKTSRRDEFPTADFSSLEMPKFLHLVEGVTEPVFYASLYTVIRPLMMECGIREWFIGCIVGPSGHMKTGIVGKYALWCDDEMEQKITIQSSQRTKDILNKMQKLPLMNFLLDDIHPTSSGTLRQKQARRIDEIVREIEGDRNMPFTFVTAENLNVIEFYSLSDRMLEIYVPSMSPDELRKKKDEIGSLSDEFMVEIAVRLAEALVKNWETAKKLVKELFADKSIDEDLDCSSRTCRFVKCIMAVELICRNLLFNNDEELSGKKLLYDALMDNAKRQQKELQRLKNSSREYDLLQELYDFLQEKCQHKEEGFIKIAKLDYQSALKDGEWVVYYSENIMYFTAENLKKVWINKYARTVDTAKVAKQLAGHGLLLQDKTAGYQKKKFDIYHYCIDLDAFEMHMKNQE